MAEPPRMHAISCQRCKSKKVGRSYSKYLARRSGRTNEWFQLRCTRTTPTCDRCKAHDAECIYLERTKKRRTRSAKIVDPAVSTSILDRLQKLENYCARLADQTPPSSHSSPTSAAGNTVSTVCPPPRSIDEDDKAGPTYPDPDPAPVTSPASHAGCSSGKGSPDSVPEVIVFQGNLLSDAVEQTRRRIMRNLTERAITETEVDVPRDTAKFWISNFLEFSQKENFSSLIDRDLLRLIPDVIGLPHIHVDATMTLIYYCALYHGVSITRIDSHPGVDWPKKLYICCLRALPGWQREATGSLTDFYAALLLMQVASDYFDRELAWQMFTLACGYVQGLQLHQVDREDRPQSLIDGKPILDRHREGFWNLIQIDFCYRLVYDKSPTLTANMDSWKVDLPALSPSAGGDEDFTSAIQFLVSSRVTFALTEYFHIMGDFDNVHDADLITKVENICVQIDDLYSEWKILTGEMKDAWVKSLSADMLRLWHISSVAFTGYLCIIFMLRKATAKLHGFTNLSDTDDLLWRIPLIQNVSYKMLDMGRVLLTTDSRFDVLCIAFGWFNVHLPYSYVAHRVIESSDAHLDEECVTLLDDLAQLVSTATESSLDAGPLGPAFRALNAQVQAKARILREQEIRT